MQNWSEKRGGKHNKTGWNKGVHSNTERLTIHPLKLYLTA